MTDHKWLCLGGPIHGQFREAGMEMLVPDKGAAVTYASRWSRRTVVIPAAPALYRPTLVALPGWRVKLPVWCEDSIARGRSVPPHGAVLPGSLQAVFGPASWVCRWCYGTSMEGQETCSRAVCITMWNAVRSLDTMTWRGEDR